MWLAMQKSLFRQMQANLNAPRKDGIQTTSKGDEIAKISFMCPPLPFSLQAQSDDLFQNGNWDGELKLHNMAVQYSKLFLIPIELIFFFLRIL